jgi:hypothetical protein
MAKFGSRKVKETIHCMQNTADMIMVRPWVDWSARI